VISPGLALRNVEIRLLNSLRIDTALKANTRDAHVPQNSRKQSRFSWPFTQKRSASDASSFGARACLA
jgi:hypothetical protein